MISPDVQRPQNAVLEENSRNGQGYWCYLPETPTPIAEGLEGVKGYGDYLETPAIIEAAQESGSVLVQGAPGAGKSHLVRDIQTGAVAYDVPTFCLTTHVNGGKATGIENVAPQLERFREATSESGGLVILDNIDYLGYRGSSRTRSASTKYAADAREMVADIIADPKLVTVATAHNDAWREGRWTWDDPAIDSVAAEVLESFSTRMVFEGQMALVGLAHILATRKYADESRRPTLGTSARVIRELHKNGHADFFHANHVDPLLYLEKPDAAIAQIEAGRSERISRA